MSTFNYCLLRRFFGLKMEYEIYSRQCNLSPPNSFTLSICFKSTVRAIRIGSNFF